jgi:hypothetical protein
MCCPRPLCIVLSILLVLASGSSDDSLQGYFKSLNFTGDDEETATSKLVRTSLLLQSCTAVEFNYVCRLKASPIW